MPFTPYPFAAAAIAACMMIGSAQARSVDVELVLMVDVSASIGEEDYELQKQGHVDAFRSPELYSAIRSGWLGRIAVTYVEWDTSQAQVVPWTVVETPEDAEAFAQAMADAPRHAGSPPATGVGSAMAMGLTLFADNGFDGMRRVIDISGDGADNVGGLPAMQRELAVGAGVTINGIVIPNEIGVEDFYRAHVIGGGGAFLIVVEDFSAYKDAIRHKLVREIAGYDGQRVVRFGARTELAALD